MTRRELHTPREITTAELQEGDRVRVSAEGVAHLSTHGNWYVRNDGGTTSWVWPGNIVTLLDRPLPPIPTADETVIRHKASRHVYVRRSGMWLFGLSSVSIGIPTADAFDVLYTP